MEKAKQAFKETGELEKKMEPEGANITYNKKALKNFKLFNITLCVFIVIRMILFFIFAMPIKTVPDYNHGGGIITAFFYFGPLIIVDLLLTIYFIYILLIARKIKRSGEYTKQLDNYFQYSLILFAVWVIVAVGALLFLFG